MALESFYGGKPGYSPIIKGSFKSIEAMNTAFANPEYTDIWYGELCIIASDSMYDANNGKIFRRTLKKQNSSSSQNYSLYAEYLGQIVGMPGGLPKVEFNTIDNIDALAQTALTNGKDIWYPTGIEEGYVHTVKTNANDSENPYSKPNPLNGTQAIELVPGVVKNNLGEIIDYNDNFEYTWLQMADPQSNTAESDGTRGTLEIGLKIPYLYFDEPEIVNTPYYENSTIEESLTAPDNQVHPFYKKYNFKIANGVNGIGIKNLRIIETNKIKENANDDDSTKIAIVDSNNNEFYYDNSTGGIKIKGLESENVVYRYKNSFTCDKIWVYDLILPSKNDKQNNQWKEPESYICYAGDYIEYTNISLNNNGTLTFNKNNGSNITTTNNMKWITSANVELNPTNNDYGKFTINYNNTEHPDIINLPLVKQIIASNNPTNNENGEVINVELTNGDESSRSLTLQKSILNEQNQITYEDYVLKYPKTLAIRSWNGNSERENENFLYLDATYNDNTTETIGSVGVSTVTKLGSYVGIGKEVTENNETIIEKDDNYLPEFLQDGSSNIFLIHEELNINENNFNNVFPSFGTS